MNIRITEVERGRVVFEGTPAGVSLQPAWGRSRWNGGDAARLGAGVLRQFLPRRGRPLHDARAQGELPAPAHGSRPAGFVPWLPSSTSGGRRRSSRAGSSTPLTAIYAYALVHVPHQARAIGIVSSAAPSRFGRDAARETAAAPASRPGAPGLRPPRIQVHQSPVRRARRQVPGSTPT